MGWMGGGGVIETGDDANREREREREREIVFVTKMYFRTMCLLIITTSNLNYINQDPLFINLHSSIITTA